MGPPAGLFAALEGAEVGDRGDLARVGDRQQRRQVDAGGLERREQRRIAAGAHGDEHAVEAEVDVVRAGRAGAGRPGHRRQSGEDAALHPGRDDAGDGAGRPVAPRARGPGRVRQAQRARAAAAGLRRRTTRHRGRRRRRGGCPGRWPSPSAPGRWPRQPCPGTSSSATQIEVLLTFIRDLSICRVSHRRAAQVRCTAPAIERLTPIALQCEHEERTWGASCSPSRERFTPLERPAAPRLRRVGRERTPASPRGSRPRAPRSTTASR